MKHTEVKHLVDIILSDEKNLYKIVRIVKSCIGTSMDPANPFMDMAEEAIEAQRLFEYDTEQEFFKDREDVFNALKVAVAGLITDMR